MLRKHLIDLLSDRPLSVTQIAHLADKSPKEIECDLRHLLLSLKHSDYVLAITPARCRKCGFEFSTDKLQKPSKCPECHSTWLAEPRLAMRLKSGGQKFSY
jgi:predicted Zn-ribbon and HTH transcriptional regulator